MPKQAKFHPEPFAYHQEITLSIETLSNMGQGIGRIHGWVVMVPFALPEEVVRARVFRNHKSYSEADLIEVLQASPDRVAPVCPLFGVCGGCQYQNLAYPAQLRWKQRQVQELLEHMAKLYLPVEPAIGSPNPYGYRSKITPHFDKPREGKIGAIGFLKYGRRFDLVDVPQCPIATDTINSELPRIRDQVHADATRYRKGATLLIRESNGTTVTSPDAVITERTGDLELQFYARDFFQNNPSILPKLVEYVVAQAVGMKTPYLIDAYCGSGLFALSASPYFEKVEGVEISESSVAWAKKNAEANERSNCRFFAGKAEEIFANVSFAGNDSTILIDPPRKGCDREFLQQLFAFNPKGVVYVSCNPATQMRDLTAFTEAGYHIKKVQPFDLFPQTKHLECVVSLERCF